MVEVGSLSCIVPPPRIPVANEGLGWDPLLKMVHNPGGDCYCEGGQPKVYPTIYKFFLHLRWLVVWDF